MLHLGQMISITVSHDRDDIPLGEKLWLAWVIIRSLAVTFWKLIIRRILK